MYEVAWTRLLTLELGHTTASAGAVLAAFMGGLALGALAAGRWTPQLTPAKALRAYAVLEIAIAGLALAVPLEISAIHPLLARAYGDGPGGAAVHLLRFSAALIVVGLPAVLMGATYPLVVIEGRVAGSLYAVNTAGAALGALVTGFFLLPQFGLFRSILVGVGGNLLVALIAWRLPRVWEKRGPSHLEREQPPFAGGKGEQSHFPVKRGGESVTVPLSLLATFVAGYAALSLEIAWTRTLAMVMGPTTYAFTTTVAAFIVGLALGSAVAALFLGRQKPVGGTGRSGRASESPAGVLQWLAGVLAAAALATGLSISRIDGLVLFVARRSVQPDIAYGSLLAVEFLRAALLVVPAAVCFGAAFPLALAAARARSGREAAWVYSANTVGAIAGSIATAAIILPALGLRGTFLLSAGLVAAMALVLGLTEVRGRARMAVTTTVVVTAAGAVLYGSRWNIELLSSGAYKYAAYLGDQDLEARLVAGTLSYYREGASGTVAVRELAGVRTLSIDGKVDASNGGDMLTQRLLAHLPLLYRPDAARVAVIGLGSGVTAGSVLTYPVSRVDVIEISPEVVEASALFAAENRRALEDRRVRLVLGDARTHFRLTPSRYDVIISEPSNPWMAGVAALFTREFFQALRSRLAPGGIVCQWAHTYDISAADFKSIVATFSAVFPGATLWLVGEGDLLLVGSDRPLPGRLPSSQLREDVRRDLALAGVTDLAVLEQFLIGNVDTLGGWLGTPALQSDDRMALEFTVPSATVGPTRENNAAALLQVAQVSPSTDPVVLRDAGLLALGAQAPERAWSLLERAVDGLPEDRRTLDGLVRAAAMSDKAARLADVEQRLRDLTNAHPGSVAARLELARLLASRGSYEDARRFALEAEQISPADGTVQEELAGIAADAGDTESLERALVNLRALRPRAAITSYFEALLRMLNGRANEAIPFARAAVAADPRHAASWNLLGSALGATAAPADEIRNAFTRAIHIDPADPAAYNNLGTLELSSGRPSVAANWFAQALIVSPAHEGALKGLAAARAVQH